MAIDGRIQTRQWDDENKQRHYRTEVVAAQVEMLAGRRKKDYAAESAAHALETQADALGLTPAEAAASSDAATDDDDELESADSEQELVAA